MGRADNVMAGEHLEVKSVIQVVVVVRAGLSVDVGPVDKANGGPILGAVLEASCVKLSHYLVILVVDGGLGHRLESL